MNTRIFKGLALSVSLLSTSAMALPSGSLTVSGVVDPVNDVVVTANGTSNTTLSITGGEAAKNIASVAETSNSILGYKINMSSTNGGELQNNLDSAKKTTYTISYGGGSYVAPAVSPAVVQVKNVTSLAALATANSPVLINVVAAPTAVAGNYSDSVTFSIVAN